MNSVIVLKKSRLEAVFDTLNKQEIRELQKFVISPFFNYREDVGRLLTYLVEQKGNNGAVDKVEIHQKLYPEKKKVDLQQVRLVMSKLLLLIEQYFTFQEFAADKNRVDLNLAAAYRKRGLEKHFQQTVRQLKKERGNQQQKNAEYFYEEFLLEQEQNRFSSKHKRTGEHNFQSIYDALDISFFAYKLRQASFSISHQAVYKKEYRIDLLEEILETVKVRNYISLPAIGVYYHAYYAFTHGDDEHFTAFKKIILEQPNVFPSEEIRDLYLLAINYCIKQLNDGQKQFADEGFALYKRGFELELLLENGMLSRFSYRNVVAIGLLLEEFEWIENFIHDYKSKLSPKYRVQTFSFNMAKLEHTRKNYDAALPLLQNIEYEDLLLNLAAKTILLKIYFELNENDLLDAHLLSLQNFLRRKTLIGYHKKNYKNIISITRKLLTYNRFDKKEKEKIRHLILDADVLTDRKWFLDMLER